MRYHRLAKNRAQRSKPMRKVFPAILFLLFLGLISSVLIIRIHYQMSVFHGQKSYCHISDGFTCDTVLASPYARLGPFFIAELGMGYYIILICGLIYSWGQKKPLSILSALFLCALLGAGFGITLNILTLAKLGVICPLCLLSTTISVVVLILLPSAMEISIQELPGTIKKLLFAPKSLLSYAAVTLLISGIGILYGRKLNPQARYSFGYSPKAYLKSFFDSPQINVALPERPVLGNPNAKVTVVAFSDMQCPGCRRAESVLNPILEQYKDRIRLIYLNYPLDPSCNPTAGRSKHHLIDCQNAKEALCANQLGKFPEYHDWAFKNQMAKSESPMGLPAQLSLDPSSFENCLASEKTAALLREDIETANLFEVRSLPSIYINGRLFRDWGDTERLRLVLESELTQATGR